LPIKILNRKKVILTFFPKGLGVGKKLYIWDKFGSFSSKDTHEISENGHQQMTSTSISFSYGLERINLHVGWFNKGVARVILTELESRANKYSSLA